MSPRPLPLLIVLAGCTPVEPHAIELEVGETTVDLGLLTTSTAPQPGFLEVRNTGADPLYAFETKRQGDGADLVIAGFDPITTIEPGQTRKLRFDMEPRKDLWYSGSFSPSFTMEIGYFFSGQESGEAEVPDSRTRPEWISATLSFSMEFTIDCDGDDDGQDSTVCGGEDCNDQDDSVLAGGVERCNGLDDDCNGLVDDDPTDAPTWYYDLDDDGWGSTTATRSECEDPGDHWASGSGDCNENDDTISPGSEELCFDNVDNDCDQTVDEGCGS